MTMATSNVTECPLCGQFTPTLSLYISHLHLVHSKDRPFGVVCGIGGCKQVFGTFSGLNTHIYRHHRFALGPEPPSDATVSSSPFAAVEPANCDLGALESGPSTDLDLDCGESSMAGQPCSKSYPPGFSAAKFILQLREG